MPMGITARSLANGQHMTTLHVRCYLVYTNTSRTSADCCHSLTRTKRYLLALVPYRVKVYNAFVHGSTPARIGTYADPLAPRL